MVRAGLGPRWKCLFANDIDAKKATAYAANWTADCFKLGDVRELTTAGLPGRADLAWASFPCQDLSLAGNYVGLKGERSGTFWPFWMLVEALIREGRAPHLVVLENVCGALTSHGGKDFAAIASALATGGYRFGALIIDAVRFVPQSRPRLFVVAVRRESRLPAEVVAAGPSCLWHPPSLIAAWRKLSEEAQEWWVWWHMPPPPRRDRALSDVIEEEPSGVAWHEQAETKRLLEMMSPVNRAKVEKAKRLGKRVVGAVYKRTRINESGRRVQRAEVRFDEVSGCLRTPVGGASRQIIFVVEGNKIRSRLLSPREAARLMGLPDSYALPDRYNDAYHLVADGVVVPVVRFLAENLLEPLLRASAESTGREAA